MPLDFWENVLHIIRAYKPNQITDSPIQASATVDVYTNIIPSRQPLPTQQQPQQPQQPTMLPHISPHPPISSFNPTMLHPAMYPNNPLLYNQHNYMNVLTAAQYIMNAAAAYNSMLSQQQQQQQQQQYTLNSPVVSPQQQHVQIKRKPVQYQKPMGYILSPQIEQRIQRKKVIPQQQQQQTRQPKPLHYPPPQQPPQQQQQQNKKKVRFDEKPTWYTYEREESDDEEQTDTNVDDDDVYYENNHDLYDDMDHHYTQTYSINSNRNGDSSHSGYMQDRPWASSIILNKRNSLKGYRYDDGVDYDEEDDDIDGYGDLWEKRYYIRRHDSLGHRPPVRRSRV